ncbi:Trifunctional UDP-glucose 4,6-dehydratase/UDP-4-keto-6-deoxy-D-glucose 3,5-epimerase/UDP-4-keto-L-rhamnose-reductase RHM3 [Orchesella cincta]|uniref:Trifunctional UDP-glucose 4,6-dehydratase/UDP-4-keto-6-deoxy-D-glucose 3,5-epimerase/UDP-4-keto-L-rhamnose-reductase RHM3 n=1 Tax=Orchesella cincta TaxID=48709 RepID=A0A1D2NDZ8_ORCCI|nr:Trifunctional UDP-glucose 4,6-dehydratase/UDP-4-keto-6-deoxy-D-glucose 3,5-epimerase/UDP-4-keto-L-rhamnose-reductase RHM3 [Orchesella cincta]
MHPLKLVKMKALIWKLFALLVALGTSAMASDKPVKNVLAFGGNGFIGSEVLNQLFADPDQYYKVALVSRGNWYFDSETRIKPHLAKRIICDREDSDIEYCKDLVDYVAKTEKIDIVLDFSAYDPEVLSNTLDLVKEKAGLYVYISTDSVYEVCKPSKTPGLAYETDAVRPSDEQQQLTLNNGDEYGNQKLLGEEILRSPENKVPFLIFRLPDVLGPRDTTDRFWAYQMWITFYKFIQVPVHVPKEYRYLKTSYVYVKDIAKAVFAGINKPEAWNDMYNLAIDRSLTLEEFVTDMAKELNETVEFDFEGEFNLFPSVTRGAVNIDKVKRVLRFVPTKWETVLKETVEFYKEGFYQFSERDDAAHQLTRYVIPKHKKGSFLQLLDKLVNDKNLKLSDIMKQPEKEVTAEQLFEEMQYKTEL